MVDRGDAAHAVEPIPGLFMNSDRVNRTWTNHLSENQPSHDIFISGKIVSGPKSCARLTKPGIRRQNGHEGDLGPDLYYLRSAIYSGARRTQQKLF